MSAERCLRTARVDQHFARNLDPAGERQLREHLPTCAHCRARYEKQLLLEQLDPDAAGPQARIASGLGIGAPRPLMRLLAPAAGALALAAVVAFLLVRPAGSSLDPNAGFTARGGSDGGEKAGSSYVLVYRGNRGDRDTRPSRAGDTIHRSDELSFGYGNESNKRFLLVYGVDEHRRVFWYYPAWSDPQDDPRSIAIEPGAHSLPDAIRHDLVGAQLEIHAVFTDSPLSVKTVEGLISGAPEGKTPSFDPEGIDRTIRFQVQP
jgi:hypothetical protein